MVKEVLLSVKGPDEFGDLAAKYNCSIKMVECRSFNSHGMSMLLEIDGTQTAALIKDLKSAKGVRRLYPTKTGVRDSQVLVILDTTTFCKAAQESEAFCISCPLTTSSERDEARWRLLVRSADDLKGVCDILESHNFVATVKDVSKVFHHVMLTDRQKEVLTTAARLGFFDFPRKKGLSEVAQEMSISSATLSEIIRSAESKIVRSYLETAEYDKRPSLPDKRSHPQEDYIG